MDQLGIYYGAFKLDLFDHYGFLEIEVLATFDKSFCAVKISLSGLPCVYLSAERHLSKDLSKIEEIP